MQFKVLGRSRGPGLRGSPVDVGGRTRDGGAGDAAAGDRSCRAGRHDRRSPLAGRTSPGSATGTLQSYISRLRRALDPKSTGDADTRIGGHWRGRRVATDSIPAGTDVVDFVRFEELGRPRPRPARRRRSPACACTCWPRRSPCGADRRWRSSATTAGRTAAASRLDERRRSDVRGPDPSRPAARPPRAGDRRADRPRRPEPVARGCPGVAGGRLVPQRAPGRGVAGDRRPSPAAG